VDNIVAMQCVVEVIKLVAMDYVVDIKIVVKDHVVQRNVVDHPVVVHFHLIIDKQTTLYVYKQTKKYS
jgi:hypothetical protein